MAPGNIHETPATGNNNTSTVNDVEQNILILNSMLYNQFGKLGIKLSLALTFSLSSLSPLHTNHSYFSREKCGLLFLITKT